MHEKKPTPKVVSSADWQAAREELLLAEKALTAEHDRLAALRRRMPWQLVENGYQFELHENTVSLSDLFDGRAQLIMYHHMFKPGDNNPCSGCSMVLDNVGHLAHLHARDTSFVVVATAAQTEIAAFQQRMGWSFQWATCSEKFNQDFDITNGFGLNVFTRDNEKLYRTYFTNGRGVEALGSNWSYLDLTPMGRQENWEDSPTGIKQDAPYQWWRLHDLYDT